MELVLGKKVLVLGKKVLVLDKKVLELGKKVLELGMMELVLDKKEPNRLVLDSTDPSHQGKQARTKLIS